MKELISFLKRYASPYKRDIALSILFNLLTAFFTLFSFAFIIPILQMLFGLSDTQYAHMAWGDASAKDVVINNFYAFMGNMIESRGDSFTLAMLGITLAVTCVIKAMTA